MYAPSSVCCRRRHCRWCCWSSSLLCVNVIAVMCCRRRQCVKSLGYGIRASPSLWNTAMKISTPYYTPWYRDLSRCFILMHSFGWTLQCNLRKVWGRVTPFDLIFHFFRSYSLSSISVPNLKFLALFNSHILGKTQKFKIGLRDPHVTSFDPILHFFVSTHSNPHLSQILSF